jgi:GGDEF domain-containing protein
VGEKILSTLSMPYPLQGYQYRSTPSIGIAPFHRHRVHTVGELLKQADLAMYQAKGRAQHPALSLTPRCRPW